LNEPGTHESGKEALADLLREFPTWGDAALHYKAENERLREALGDAKAALADAAIDLEQAGVAVGSSLAHRAHWNAHAALERPE
jgi:hypothetical protein